MQLSNLKSRLVLPNLGAVAILSLLAFFLWIPQIRDHQANNLAHEQYMLLQAMAPEIGHHLLEGDSRTVIHLLDAHAKSHPNEWKRLRLVDRSGNQLYPQHPDNNGLADNTTEITYPVMDHNQHQLATLTLEFDIGPLLDTAMQPYFRIALTIILVVLIVTLSIIWLQNKWVTKPIARLNNAIGELANGHFNVEMEQSQTGEIQNLINNFVYMREQLGRSQSELLKNLESIKNAEIQYETIVKTVYDPLITSDDKGVIISVNNAVTRLFGYTTDELIGQRINMLMPSSEAKHHDQYLDNHVNSGKVRVVNTERQLIARRKDGSEFPIDLALSSMELSGKRFYNALIRDITERVTAEQQLIEEKARADASNRAKTVFLSRVSHELHTPLNAILGFAQLLDEDARQSFTTEQCDNIREILQAGEHLHALIDEIIHLAESEETDVNEDNAFISCHELLVMTKEHTEEIASEKQINFNMHIDPECKDVIVDLNSEKLGSVLVELMTNAIKFNHQGGDLTLSCHYIGPDCVRFSVTDSGDGLSEEECLRLFQPFERLGAEYSNVPGSGFGLVRCQNILKQVDSQLQVDSTKGKGCTFWFDINRLKEKRAADSYSAVV